MQLASVKIPRLALFNLSSSLKAFHPPLRANFIKQLNWTLSGKWPGN